MKFLHLLILLFISIGCNRPVVPDKIQKDVESIINSWVPDKSEDICVVNLSLLSRKTFLLKGETNLPGAWTEILNYFDSCSYKYIDSLLVLPDTSDIKKAWGLVSISVCNIRKSPSHSSELVSQAIMGTPVKIFKKHGGWILLQSPDHYVGWASSSGLVELNEREISDWRESERVIFKRKSGEILGEPGNDMVISDIVSGSILKEKGIMNGFFHVVLPDGREGFIKETDSENFKQWTTTVFPDPDKLKQFSESLLGSPYLWGGTSTKALDCSGFMKTTYFSNGIILARDASQQYLYGRPVECSGTLDSLKNGDLIFFGYLNDGNKRITHVGMYIGNTEVIHCSGMVRISSLDSSHANYSEYLKAGMMGARRIIGEESGKGLDHVASHGWYLDN